MYVCVSINSTVYLAWPGANLSMSICVRDVLEIPNDEPRRLLIAEFVSVSVNYGVSSPHGSCVAVHCTARSTGGPLYSIYVWVVHGGGTYLQYPSDLPQRVPWWVSARSFKSSQGLPFGAGRRGTHLHPPNR